jgi:CBS domain-containing membrane protein
VIGGNVISTLVGIAVSQTVPDPFMASGLAVGLAILLMSLTRSLHPPGGAAALSAVLGGPTIAASGFGFAIVPVGVNAALMVLVAVVFHRLAGNAYPHRVKPQANTHGTADRPPATRVGFTEVDIDRALTSLDETFDIDRNDLSVLLRRVELEALDRDLGSPRCADIMSRDVVTIGLDATINEAEHLLLLHNIRTLPELDEAGQLAGTVGLRELVGSPGSTIRERLSQARIAAPDDRATSLLPVLTDGRYHAVVVTNADSKVLGIVTQTDLLSTLFRPSPGVVSSAPLTRA